MLHYFDKEPLFKELDKISKWYDSCDILHENATEFTTNNGKNKASYIKLWVLILCHKNAKEWHEISIFKELLRNDKSTFRVPRQHLPLPHV